jgi:hypothetical protein
MDSYFLCSSVVSFTHCNDVIEDDNEESLDVIPRYTNGHATETFQRGKSHSNLKSRQQTPGIQVLD